MSGICRFRWEAGVAPMLKGVLASALVIVSVLTPGLARAIDDPFARHPRRATPPVPQRTEGRCGDPRGVSFWSFPDHPVEGRPMRFVAVSEHPREARMTVDGPGGERVASTGQRQGGPPYAWIAEIPAASAGTYRGRLTIAGDAAACVSAEVPYGSELQRTRPTSSLWPIEHVWDRETENLYSAWIAKLFDDPLDASPSWNSLHAVTRDPARNFLHDSLGLGEDSEQGGLSLEPDCADLPYFLRGYFAWKLRLPFVYSRCYSVGQKRAPVCGETRSNLELSASRRDSLPSLQKFFSRNVADTAHSATGRTAAMDDRTDVYPVRISADTLRPGTVYIDPYGHVLIIAKRVDQTPTSSGVLFAVDAQPDGTVARKRYWRGTFLFALSDSSAPGFKRFRPVVPDGDSVRTLDNAEIVSHPAYGDWSMEQYEGSAEDFYDKVDRALSPNRRSARQVLHEVVDLLHQQLEQRVASVQGGETYVQRNPGTIGMPGGAAIFQTVGAWEDYATPSRDLRLLIAIDVVRGFPDYVAKRPSRFYAERGANPANLRGELEAMLDYELTRRSVQYQRSDGTPWTLKLSDVIGRADALEMAYNPNDCIEKRWGAEDGSIEIMTCRRHAPEGQIRQMRDVRDWFRTRTRPAT
jgi:hypothetical protein